MDISCVFIISKYGDVILSKDYLFDGILGKIAPEFRQRLFNELDDDEDICYLPDEQPYFTYGEVTAYFLFRNDVYFVSCCCSRLRRPPILALDFLSTIFDLFCSLCRISPDDLDAKALLKHQILCYEILDEVASKGQVQVTSPDKIRNLVYSPLPAAASSAISSSSSSMQKLSKLLPNSMATPQLSGPEGIRIFDPGLLSTAYSVVPSALRHAVSTFAASARQASSDGDVFVDVVERVSLKLSADGIVELFRLQGQIVVETRLKSNLEGGGGGGASSPRIKMFLPEDVLMEQDETGSSISGSSNTAADPIGDAHARPRGFTGSTTVLSKCVFHPRCRTAKMLVTGEVGQKPEIIIEAINAEKIVALTYEVNRDYMKNPPPLHIDLSVGPRFSFCSSSKSRDYWADVSIVLTSRMHPMTKAAAIKVTLPVPDYILQATRLTTSLPYIQGVEQSMDFDRKNSRIIWSIRHLPGKSCIDLKTRITWQSANNSSLLSSIKDNEGNEDDDDDDNENGPPPSSQFIFFSPSSSVSLGAPSAVSPAASDAPAAPHNLDVGPAFLEFELSGFSQSGFRIEALKFVNSSFVSTAKMKKDTQNINRWLRYITLDGKDYLFAAL